MNLIEEIVSNADEALEKMEIGSRNRKVAATLMNQQSSRSHSVFTIYLQSEEMINNGKNFRARSSRFHLVDLAGSERQKDTGTSGEHLKEAGSINRSLLTLGNVIMALVDIANGRHSYVRYRDSKLTFLLKDSLGGNSLTYLIATISPYGSCVGESISTLKFASKAKTIKNQAVVNETRNDNVADEYLIQENIQLKEKLRQLLGMFRMYCFTLLIFLPENIQQLQERQSNSSESVQPFSTDDLISDVLQQSEEYRESIARLRLKIEKLEELCGSFNQRQLSDAMIRRLQRRHIDRLQLCLKTFSQADSNQKLSELQEIVDSQTSTYLAEVEELEKQIKAKPNQLELLLREFDVQEQLERVSQLSKDRLDCLQDFNQHLSEKCVSLMQLNDQCTTELAYLKKKMESQLKVDGVSAAMEAQAHHFNNVLDDLKQKLAERDSKCTELQKMVDFHQNELTSLKETHSFELNEIKNVLEQQIDQVRLFV
jgi:kinesin family protein 15